MNDLAIEPIIRQVTAILGEAQAQARTGRTRPDLSQLPTGGLARLIDHTLLRPEVTARQIEMLCLEARQWGFFSVCVNSAFVPLAVELLRETPTLVASVVGFPLGANLPHVKAYEARQALEQGAREIDMVIHIGALKGRDLLAVFEDIGDVAVVCHEHDALCKVILETSLLTPEEIVIGCQLARMAGADFVKTSTGFNEGGATVEAVALMRRVVGDSMGIKASGGIRTLASAQAMLQAGANRLGTSASVAIVSAEQGSHVSSDSASSY
ncbi:MAG: deoxyribose-phosphate aldolase [Anaerolineae bacterium]|nr:deoxyribose-phosphate aldolase [Anaerolineae bacterium]MDW8173529.1 deoxyribose-phosphate aldolase [Anaerolineae bacterium]